ncbi:MAG: peptide chain release factor 1 [Bacillota bacterium]|nr:peptide chain release factor 1 [Bacillota bacterium]
MFDKLEKLEEKYEELSLLISDPEIINDQTQWQKYVRSHSELEDVVAKYRQYKAWKVDLEGTMEILAEDDDAEMREMADTVATDLREKMSAAEEEMKIMLLPKDPNDAKNVIMEIRAGTGGEEAALFANDLFKMYSRYVEKQGWKLEIMNSNFTDIGGVKEVICLVEGKNAYSRLKYESGVHRVQRVPDTETQGRVHTSAATVAVMPEAEDVEVEIGPNDIKTDVFCASGPGGQCVNTTQSAVRLTHIPTGIVVSCQDEKSQLRNKEKAMKVLRARIYEVMQEEIQGDISSQRKSMVGSGDRSERIRTFNFPQGRVTDHRVGLTLHRLDNILDGELDEIIEALISSEQMKQLQAEVE